MTDQLVEPIDSPTIKGVGVVSLGDQISTNGYYQTLSFQKRPCFGAKGAEGLGGMLISY